MTIRGVATIDLVIRGSKVRVDFIVIPKLPVGLILGRQFMQAAGVVLDFESLKLHITKIHVSIDLEPAQQRRVVPENTVLLLRATQKTTITPEHDQCVDVYVANTDYDYSSFTGFVGNSIHTSKHGIGAGKGLIDVHNGHSVIHVANFRKKDYVVFKHDVIAAIEICTQATFDVYYIGALDAEEEPVTVWPSALQANISSSSKNQSVSLGNSSDVSVGTLTDLSVRTWHAEHAARADLMQTRYIVGNEIGRAHV